MEHRKTPAPYRAAPRGYCKWCGFEIERPDGSLNRRRSWHPSCVEAYSMQWSSHARKRVRHRDRGLCAGCGLYARHWHVDHILPLIDGGTHDLSNLQTLCRYCHRAKTAQEAQARATLRRVTKLGAE